LHDVDVVDYDGDALDFLFKLVSLAGFFCGLADAAGGSGLPSLLGFGGAARVAAPESLQFLRSRLAVRPISHRGWRDSVRDRRADARRSLTQSGAHRSSRPL
jgi:hypothetical protein